MVLLLFREAVEEDQGLKNERGVDVMAVVEGGGMEVRCSVCGEIRTWIADRDWLKRQMRRM